MATDSTVSTGGINLPTDLERVRQRLPLSRFKVDFAVDHNHVETIKGSLQRLGQLSDITVWTNDDIIDGFHRVQGMTELGWQEADFTRVYCTREQFLDARITSAVIHHNITFPRIVFWARESFSETKWSKQLEVVEAFKLDRKFRYPLSLDELLKKGIAMETLREIARWVKEKSDIWGISPQRISSMLELADLTSPFLISLVRERNHTREAILTRITLKTIVKAIENPEVQEAVAKKAIAEKMTEEEVQRLVSEYTNTETAAEQSMLLSTSWIDLQRRKKIKEKEENKKIFKDRDAMKENDRWKIQVILSQIANLVDFFIRMDSIANIRDFPDQKAQFDTLLDLLLIEISKYKGEDKNIDGSQIIKLFGRRMDELKKENIILKRENNQLKDLLKSCRRTLGIRDQLWVEDQKRPRELS